jgi:hypothetical protein
VDPTNAQNRERIAYDYAAAVERVKKSKKLKETKAKVEKAEAEVKEIKGKGKRGVDDENVDATEDVFLKKKKKTKKPLSLYDPNAPLSHNITNAELMFLQNKIHGFSDIIFDMCSNIREKIDDEVDANFQDEPAITEDNFDMFKIRIIASNVSEVEAMRSQTLNDLAVDRMSDDRDVAEISQLFMKMSAERSFKYPIACGMVIINPLFSIHRVIETMDALYLSGKQFYILLPSSFLYIEEFAILFMGKRIAVHHILPIEGDEGGMAWFHWDGTAKQAINVRYVFNFAGMEKMDYHTDELNQMKEAELCDSVGESSEMLYETDLKLIEKLGESASDDAKELLRQSTSSGSASNNFDDGASTMSSLDGTTGEKS